MGNASYFIALASLTRICSDHLEGLEDALREYDQAVADPISPDVKVIILDHVWMQDVQKHLH